MAKSATTLPRPPCATVLLRPLHLRQIEKNYGVDSIMTMAEDQIISVAGIPTGALSQYTADDIHCVITVAGKRNDG